MGDTSGIKANTRSQVKRIAVLAAGGLALALGWMATPTRAEDPPVTPEPMPSASDTPAPTAPLDPSETENLPDIEARTFDMKIAKRSKSGRTYLLDDVTDAGTHPGKILLLKRDGEAVMAFRVLKIYADKKQVAAKRVRTYADVNQLEAGSSYLAHEKVGDVVLPPPTAQDKADIKELEAPNAATTPPATAPAPDIRDYDTDLDVGTSPPPSGAIDSENAKAPSHPEEEDDPTSRFGVTIDEVNPIDPNVQWLTAGFGYFNNAGYYFAGGGVRYGVSLGRMVFLRRAHLQDSITVEAGAFFYKIINFESKGDSYSVLPFIGTVRYNLLFGENFGIFFYGGMVENIVTEVSGGTAETQASLQRRLPAAGGGVLFRVGPNWNVRADLGYDMVGLGLVLRF